MQKGKDETLPFPFACCVYFFSGVAAEVASLALGVSAGAGAAAAAGTAGAEASSFFPQADNATASMAAIRNEFFIAGFLLI